MDDEDMNRIQSGLQDQYPELYARWFDEHFCSFCPHKCDGGE